MFFGSNLASYTGQVATRCQIAQDFNTSVQLMSRSAHIARDDITSLQIAIPNWYVVAGGAETGRGATATVTASIEYPAATFTQVLFGASASGTIADITTRLSDAVAVTIPSGATFFVRIHWANANGFVYCDGSSALGDRLSVGASITDATMSGSVPDGVPGYRFSPVAIVASTIRRSALLIGSSRTHGTGDTYDSTGDLGILARSIGPGWGYINAGNPSDTAVLLIASHALRVALAAYVSDVIVELGVNDDVSQLATLEANLQTIGGYFPGKRVWIVTDAPQTDAGNTSIVVDYTSLNTWKRTKPSPFFGVHDVASALTAAGKWGNSAWTTGGVHLTQLGNLKVKDGGQIAI